jgi:hypothetical protein
MLHYNIYVTDGFIVRNHQKTESYRGVDVQLNTMLILKLEESELPAHAPATLLPRKEQLIKWETGLAQRRLRPAGNQTQIAYPITDLDIPARTKLGAL